MYAIYESEMDTIGTLNEISTVAYSIATSCLGFALSLWVQANMAKPESPVGEAIIALGIPGSFAIGVVALCVGIRFSLKRQTALERIKSESRTVAPPEGV